MNNLSVLPPVEPASFQRLSELMLGHKNPPLSQLEVELAIRYRTVMVTGAGGSIGGMICQKLARMQPEQVIMFDISEAALYATHRDLRFDKRFVPIMGDIRDKAKLAVVMRDYAPALILHAAALKHVDMLEIPLNLAEAVSTNIVGTDRVCEAAAKIASKVVMISTDKAVYPSSVLGLTKRVAERVVGGWWSSGYDMSVVRFGNVMNSSGSAIPLFRQQIATGGPVTITDVNMTRYMMTLGQAVDLVLHAASSKCGLYVLDMGDPIKVIDLAVMLIRMADKEPLRDVEIVEIGMRPGEKVAETLMYAEEAERMQQQDGMFFADLPLTRPDHWQAIQKVLKMDIVGATKKALSVALTQACPEYEGE